MTYKEYLVELGAKIHNLRFKRKITQKELAKKSNLNEALISKIENGKTKPSFESIFKIAEAFDMEVWELMKVEG